jgi:hypothetical protein
MVELTARPVKTGVTELVDQFHDPNHPHRVLQFPAIRNLSVPGRAYRSVGFLIGTGGICPAYSGKLLMIPA